MNWNATRSGRCMTRRPSLSLDSKSWALDLSFLETRSEVQGCTRPETLPSGRTAVFSLWLFSAWPPLCLQGREEILPLLGIVSAQRAPDSEQPVRLGPWSIPVPHHVAAGPRCYLAFVGCIFLRYFLFVKDSDNFKHLFFQRNSTFILLFSWTPC